MGASLANSNICRICALEFDKGVGLFGENEDKASLVILINKYLPITVFSDGVYPSCICEHCHSGVAATVDLIDRMVDGQHALRSLLQHGSLSIIADDLVPGGSAVTLIDLQGCATDIPMDDVANGGVAAKVYGEHHPLSHWVAGTSLKKKRGRPRKPAEQRQTGSSSGQRPAPLPPVAVEAAPRPRRKTVMPSRFRDGAAGDALEGLVGGAAPVGTDEGEPSIFVAGEGGTVATDVPFALNIEILEQDGNFILRGIENFGNLQQLEGLKVVQQDESLVLQQAQGEALLGEKDGDQQLQYQNVQVQSYLLKENDAQEFSIDFNSLESNALDSSALQTETDKLISSNLLSQSNLLPSNLFSSDHHGRSFHINLSKNLPQHHEDHLESNQVDSRLLHQHLEPQVLQHQLHCVPQHQLTRNIVINHQSDQHQPSNSINIHDELRPAHPQHQQQSNCVDISHQLRPDQVQHQLPTTINDHVSSELTAAPRTTYKKEVSSAPRATYKKVSRRKCRYKCPICAKTFLRVGRYKYHMSLHGSVIVHCLVCNVKYKDHVQLSQHQKETQHEGVGIMEEWPGAEGGSGDLRCKVCPGRTFTSLESYQKHFTTVHSSNGKQFGCDLCPKKFVYQHSLRCHVKQCHSSLDKPPNGNPQPQQQYPCEVCCKVFNHPSSLSYHRDSSHNTGRYFVCSICGAPFKHKQLLQRHYSVHCKLRPHVCTVCGKSFKTRCNLLNHSVMHNKEKKYTCELCGKQFNHLTSITLHIRSHTGEKPFSCPHCDKKFAQNGNMREHARIHTGEKPFSCGVCSKRFTTSSQARFHSRVHDKKQPLHSVKERKAAKVTTVNIDATNTATGAGDATTFMCPHCCQTIPDTDALASHRCHQVVAGGAAMVAGGAVMVDAPAGGLIADAVSTMVADPSAAQHLLSNGSHAWLVAGPGTEDDQGAGVGLEDPLSSEGAGNNIIYILSNKDDPQHHDRATFQALQQGAVQLVDASQLAVQAEDQCWTQLYSSGGEGLLPSLVAGDSAAHTQPLQADAVTVKGSPGPVTLLLPPHHLLAQLD